MNRREFIIVGGTLSVAAVAGLQGQPVPRRVAALLTNDNAANRNSLARFHERLQQLGWSNGTNVQMDLYWAGDDYAKTRAHVPSLIETRPDVILSQGTIGLRALTEHKVTTIPIVFVQVTDPAGEGFVRSLARPGGNITGFANFPSTVARERVRLLKDVAPGITRVMVVRDATYETPPGLLRNTEVESDSLGIGFHARGVRDADELERAITEFGRTPGGALVVLGGSIHGTPHEPHHPPGRA